ncbi:helix-turn-helix domain-containing protein [Sphingomonas sp. SRS2]|uniref:helix-turn-helix domain-containing protein n=1 Tax=Sphingomonas sp. SRS2 TaxID=133190 RepID=UPI000A07B819|nr:helix-turn-helix transcriptional regulator [Sphingomonas sp. SRS2]
MSGRVEIRIGPQRWSIRLRRELHSEDRAGGFRLSVKIGHRLACHRRARGLSPEAAAMQLGIAPIILAQIETGLIEPTIGQIQRAAEIFGVQPEELAFGNNLIDVHQTSVPLPLRKICDPAAVPDVMFVPLSMIDTRGTSEAFYLSRDMPGLLRAAGEVIIVDTVVREMGTEPQDYLIEGADGLEIVRVEPQSSTPSTPSTATVRRECGKLHWIRKSTLVVRGQINWTMVCPLIDHR